MAWLKPHPIPTNPFCVCGGLATATLFVSHISKKCQKLSKTTKFYKKMRGVCQRFDRELVGVMEPKYVKLKNHYPRVHLKDTPIIRIKKPPRIRWGLSVRIGDSRQGTVVQTKE